MVSAVVARGPPSPPSPGGLGEPGPTVALATTVEVVAGVTPPLPLWWGGEMGSTTTLAVMHLHNKTSHAVSHVLSPPAPGKLLIYIKSVLPPSFARDWY